MRQLCFQKLAGNRPVINVFTKHNSGPALFHEALLDTGAVFPVFTKGSAVLTSLGGKLIKKDLSFNGFGGTANADLFEISVFLVDSDGRTIVFPNMSILCIDDSAIGFPFVLSATMFEEFDYTIRNKKQQIIFETDSNQLCYLLRIQDNDGKLNIFLNSVSEEAHIDTSWIIDLLNHRNIK